MRRRHTPPESSPRQEPAPAAGGPALAIDFPPECETIGPGQYTIRISAPQAAQDVEVSVNQGPWLACRQGSRFWWCDWSGIEPGSYQARARMRTADGPIQLTFLRRFRAGP